jgi:hypothetical protein
LKWHLQLLRARTSTEIFLRSNQIMGETYKTFETARLFCPFLSAKFRDDGRERRERKQEEKHIDSRNTLYIGKLIVRARLCKFRLG